MKLYSFKGEYPEILPKSARSFREDQLQSMGYIGPIEEPEWFPYSKLEWSRETRTLTRLPLSLEEKLENEDKRWTRIREIRNEKLAETDYIVLVAFEKNELVDPTWIKYRQDLRDIPSTFQYTWEIVWPVMLEKVVFAPEDGIPTEEELAAE